MYGGKRSPSRSLGHRSKGSECGASAAEYLLLLAVLVFTIRFGITEITRSSATELIRSACVIELGGGTAGTVSDDEREGAAPGRVTQRAFLTCMHTKLVAAGLAPEGEEPEGQQRPGTAVPISPQSDSAPARGRESVFFAL